MLEEEYPVESVVLDDLEAQAMETVRDCDQPPLSMQEPNIHLYALACAGGHTGTV
jgi:hypothetical protein